MVTAMPLSITEDICSVAELQRDANSILAHLHSTKRPVILTVLAHLHSTKRPVILTVNGKADAVLVDASEYEKTTRAFNVLKLLIPAEEDIQAGRYAEATDFFEKFKRGNDI